MADLIVHCETCGAAVKLGGTQQTCEYCGSPVRAGQTALARALRIETAGGVASILLPRGTALPASYGEVYSTATDNQDGVGIHLLEGDADAVGECRSLGWFTMTGLGARPKGVPQIQFTVEVSAEGETKIEVEDLETGNRKSFRGPRLPVMK
jgi:molecular chaperone DnaK (HSP70)